MILVVGATGEVGRRVCRLLADKNGVVRALTRDPKRARTILDSRTEIFHGDLRDAQSIGAAVRGCYAIVDCATGHSTWRDRHNTARAVDDRGTAALVRSAREAGVSRIVYISALGSAPDAPTELLRMKYRAEWHVLHSGMHFTILRPAALAETWLEPLAERVSQGRSAWIPGSSRAPISWVSAEDAARLAVLSLSDPDLEDRTMDVGGSSPLSVDDVVAAMEYASGRTVIHAHVPAWLLRVSACAWSLVDPSFAERLRFGWCVAAHPQTCEAAGLQRMIPEWRPESVKLVAANMASSA